MDRNGMARRIFLCLGLMMCSGIAEGQEEQPTPAKAYPNLPTPTLGGMQFWTDYRWNDGWRLQQHAITGHWRLLSPKNIRTAWGSRAACEQVMDQRVDPDRVADQRIVVLIHGLMRTSHSMEKLGRSLETHGEDGSATGGSATAGSPLGRPVTFGYASTRRGIAEHAAALRQWLETLPGEPHVDFVCHSMGNIVVRHALADWQREGDPRGVVPRIGCFVMLGPPNQGADIARQLGKLGLFEIVTGKGAMELGPAWEEFQTRLAIPTCPFAIVAGDTSQGWIKNPILRGPSDLIVRIDEARLDGCAEFHTVPVMHSILMNNSAVQKIVYDFLCQHAPSATP